MCSRRPRPSFPFPSHGVLNHPNTVLSRGYGAIRPVEPLTARGGRRGDLLHRVRLPGRAPAAAARGVASAECVVLRIRRASALQGSVPRLLLSAQTQSPRRARAQCRGDTPDKPACNATRNLCPRPRADVAPGQGRIEECLESKHYYLNSMCAGRRLVRARSASAESARDQCVTERALRASCAAHLE